MKILCGTDFSVHAAEAANVAAALANRLRGTLVLVHVLEATRYELSSGDHFEHLRQQRLEKLEHEADRLRRTGAKVVAEMGDGSPSTTLAEVATRCSAGLVVVSSLGQIAPSRWLVGSVAERLAQRSPLPTLVVRGDKALLSWARDGRPLKILLGFDTAGSSDPALEWVAGLRNIGPCQIVVATLAWPPHESMRLGIPVPVAFSKKAPHVEDVLERDLHERCVKILGKDSFEIRVGSMWGTPDPELIELAREEHADLIVIGTRQLQGLERFWHGSVSRGVLHHAPMSVACVPTPEKAPPQNIPEFTRVLIPTDFSVTGDKAIPTGYATLPRGGTVCLIHVLEPELSDRKARTPSSKRIRKIRDQLSALVPVDAKARGISTEVQVVESLQPATAINQAAERFGADVVCIGSHGRSGWSKAILGSVAQEVLLRSLRPVLVVRATPP